MPAPWAIDNIDPSARRRSMGSKPDGYRRRVLVGAIAIAAIAASLVAGGCRKDRGARPIEGARFIDSGRVLIRPAQGPIVVWRDPSPWMSGGGGGVGGRLARIVDQDGRRVTASAWWCPASPWAGGIGAWVGSAQWGTPIAMGRRGAGEGTGIWIVTIEPAAGTTQLAVGDQTWTIDDAKETPRSGEDGGGPATDGSMADLLAPALADPMNRWRVAAIASSARENEDPAGVLGSLASQVEADWHEALRRLREADAAMAPRLHERLTTFVRSPEALGGQSAPAWTGDAPRDLTLLVALLDGPPMARVRAADQWLSDEPRMVSWVVDDAGLRDGLGGEPVWTIAVANLGAAEVVVTASGAERSSDPRRIEAGRAGLLYRGSGAAPTTDGGIERVIVREGTWSQVHDVAADEAPLKPPGARIGPLLEDWTRASWLSGEIAGLPDDSWATGGMLFLDASESDGAGAGPWRLLIESRFDPTVRTGEGEALRLWLGSSLAASAVIQVSIDGTATAEIGGVDARAVASGVQVRRSRDRWSAIVPIPGDCLDESGAIRLGLERIDARGRRWAWPRAMLPWQLEPGRAAFDTRRWDGGLANPARGVAPEPTNPE